MHGNFYLSFPLRRGVKEALRREAQARGQSMGRVAAEFIEQGLHACGQPTRDTPIRLPGEVPLPFEGEDAK